MARKIIIANWKMHPLTLKLAVKLYREIAKGVSRVKKTNVVVCPPAIYLENLSKIRTSKVKLGAQNSFGSNVGAFTGEVSPEMLYGLSARYVILGHSERRALGETNALVNKKIKGALAEGLTPIVCVGEKERDENHEYYNFIKSQIEECLTGISKNSTAKIIIAYEPIWAISSTEGRRDATPEDASEMTIFIKKVISDKFGANTELPKVIYGGSVNDKDASGFLKDGGVDGLLVGKASLDSKKFTKVIETCEALKN